MTIATENAARFASRRTEWERAWQNAANAETLDALDADLRRLRLLAHIARAKGERIHGAATEIITAAAERLEER